MGSIRGLEEIINKLKASLIELRCESTWASTTLGDDQTANVYYFHAKENAKKIIRLITKSLYEWEMPNSPEDLSFFKQGKFWFGNFFACKTMLIYPENDTEASRIKDIEGLRIQKLED
ncbi:stage III sporulation protein AH [Peribacillus simplex]